MPLLVLGQKRKGLTAFSNAVKILSSANEKAAAIDYEGALAGYNQALELLRSDACRQALDGKLIPDCEWSENVVAGTLGKVRCIVALDRRSIVFEHADKMM